jgi:hypothetical protein
VGKRWTWVVWSMLAVFVVSLVLEAILAVANSTLDPVSFAGLSLGFAAFMVVGALIVAHRPTNAIGWMFSAIALLACTAGLAAEYATYTVVTRPGSLPGATFAAWHASWSWYPAIALALVFTPLLFPTGRLLSPAGGRSPGGRGRPPEAAARRAGLEDVVEKVLTGMVQRG